ncbi:hypothetical protein PIB30_004042 [Stylosanthes scabra]|uniref:Secreted protein n=1 Tax=Stylosanthes scabra TaxID=79078 RepID=A0ABU6Y5C7_9FABA|nr:hypothetical protein [Stylosanthes scabra]
MVLGSIAAVMAPKAETASLNLKFWCWSSVPWDQVTSASKWVASLTCRPHVGLVLSYGHTRGKGYPERWSCPVFFAAFTAYGLAETSSSSEMSSYGGGLFPNSSARRR